jgi:glutathione S-transferase
MLFHLADGDEWRACFDAGRPYARSMPGVALDAVGFVHLSYEEQVAATAERHYPDRRGLVLLTVDPALLAAEVREEGGFPHAYGPLDLAAVVAVEPWS